MGFLIITTAIAFLWVLFIGLAFSPRLRQFVAGGVVKLTKVIYRDGTSGDVESSTMDELRKEGKIDAYRVLLRWVKVRRKQQSNPDYNGVERRKDGQSPAKSP